MTQESETSREQSWLGTPLQDMYKNQTPWNFYISPLIPSKSHHVLFELPANLKDPPKPHYNRQPKHWGDGFVRMPYSPQNLFLVKQDNEEIIRPRWDIITETYSKPITSVEELEKAINSYNNKLPSFSALHHFFNEVLEEDETQHFFEVLLPKIIKLALNLPKLIPGSIPLLQKNNSRSISLSQLQVASLLANAFLCTFVWRKETIGAYPGINFVRLFAADGRITRQNSLVEKFKCIFHYFKRVTTKNPVGTITFKRKYIPKNCMPRWDLLDNNLGNTRIHITCTGAIEEGQGFLQVDFANKFVGGGILGYGCVQEEIRFVICPELIISRLFTEELGDGESLIITGVERYSNYAGYADSFKWEGNCNDETPFDEFGRRKTTVAVIDATRFTKPKDQFHCSTILRELNKAYVGFSCFKKENLAPVATGNWGCGAFKGDPNLKSLIQLMACSAARRDLVYYSFGNTDLRDEFYKMHLFLANNKITICQLWRYLSRFCAAYQPPQNLYSFIQQCYFEMKSQPTLKQFLCFNTQKRKTDLPSTSSEEVPKTDVTPQNKQARSESPKNKERIEKRSLSSEEIIQIIDLFDGEISTPSRVEESSFLDELDKMKKCEEAPKQESMEIAMEVDEDDESKPLSFIEDKKKKITDYFSKMTNHVNSYL